MSLIFLMNIVKAYSKAPKDPIARAALSDIVGDKAVFRPGAKLDAAEIEQVLEFLSDLGENRALGGRYKNYQTLAEYEGANKRGLSMDPSAEDVVLDPHGISQDAAEIDWSGVSRERRLLVIHGRDIGKIAKNPDPETRQRWAGELSDPPNATLGGQWAKIADSLRALRASEREALEDRLVYRRRVEQPTPSALPAPVGPSATAATMPLAQRALDERFRTDSDFEAFVLDFFPDVQRRFGSGMNRTAKTSLLLQYKSLAEIATALARR